MQTVIETLDTISPTPPYTLTPKEAGMQPFLADAAMRVMRNFNIPTSPMNVDTMGKEIPVQNRSIHVRIYIPKTVKSSYSLIVYYHSGGWVIATLDTYNASAEALAEQEDAIVVSVEYAKLLSLNFLQRTITLMQPINGLWQMLLLLKQTRLK